MIIFAHRTIYLEVVTFALQFLCIHIPVPSGNFRRMARALREAKTPRRNLLASRSFAILLRLLESAVSSVTAGLDCREFYDTEENSGISPIQVVKEIHDRRRRSEPRAHRLL